MNLNRKNCDPQKHCVSWKSLGWGLFYEGNLLHNLKNSIAAKIEQLGGLSCCKCPGLLSPKKFELSFFPPVTLTRRKKEENSLTGGNKEELNPFGPNSKKSRVDAKIVRGTTKVHITIQEFSPFLDTRNGLKTTPMRLFATVNMLNNFTTSLAICWSFCVK